jgi:hypothetical protein
MSQREEDMNCKQGDLAVIIKSQGTENLGKILTCVRLATADELREAGFKSRGQNWWVVDQKIALYRRDTGEFIKYGPYAPDQNLMPIRRNDGEGVFNINEQPITERS